MDDAELLAEAARGNADAFAKFYRRHLALVVAFCERATGDRELGADLAVRGQARLWSVQRNLDGLLKRAVRAA
ncbi:MAG: hypothetical protein ACXVXL_24855 [Solirubrobacteraceae bacterium]